LLHAQKKARELYRIRRLEKRARGIGKIMISKESKASRKEGKEKGQKRNRAIALKLRRTGTFISSRGSG